MRDLTKDIVKETAQGEEPVEKSSKPRVVTKKTSPTKNVEKKPADKVEEAKVRDIYLFLF